MIQALMASMQQNDTVNSSTSVVAYNAETGVLETNKSPVVQTMITVEEGDDCTCNGKTVFCATFFLFLVAACVIVAVLFGHVF
jgi:hypothetical protein